MSYDASDLSHQLGALITTPNGIGGSIWQSGHGLPADDAGNFYAITGNGDFDGNTNLSQSFLKFSGSAPALADWYAPANCQYLTDHDYDLSAGAALVPGTHMLLGGDKMGQLYLVNGDAMGHQGGNGQVIQGVQWGGVFNFALWNRPDGAYVFVQEQGTVVKSYRIVNGQLGAAPLVSGTVTSDLPYDGMAISANGTRNGILWETTATRSDPAPRPATLHAYDALTLRELWNSGMAAGDSVGAFAKFATPTVANGSVYVPTFSNAVVVYGLLQGPTTTPITPTPAIAAVANAASGSQSGIAPGEVVTIQGINLGPGTPVTSQAGPSGVITTPNGVQVLFDGVPAPVLYASAGQINAVVPFSATLQVARVQVRFQGRPSMPFPVPVVPAEPGIFTSNGSGRGAALVMNQDGSLNSPGNAAKPGSVIVLYATGLGALSPAPRDGELLRPESLPKPVLPVSAEVGGLPAQVLYAGSAPGMVAGVIQINLQLPGGVTPAPDVPVVVRADAWVTRQTATVAISQ
jgi:uncharacterized protein (TIGR03437 family)